MRWARNTRRCAPTWRVARNACARRSAAAARLEAQIRQLAARREELARELERMGVDRARLLADNIELDQRAAVLAGETAAAAALRWSC